MSEVRAPLLQQDPPPSIHAMGMQVREPINVLQWADPRCEGTVQINVPSPVNLRVDKDLVVLFPVGTYHVPVKITTTRQVMNAQNTFDDRPLVTYLGGLGDDTKEQHYDGTIVNTSIHWYLKQHGARHAGQPPMVAPGPRPPASAPPADPRDLLIERQAKQIEDLSEQVSKLTGQLDRLLDRLDAPPKGDPAVAQPTTLNERLRRARPVGVDRAGPPTPRRPRQVQSKA